MSTGFLRSALAISMAVGLAACGALPMGGSGSSAASATPATPAPPPTDPLLIFAAGSGAGSRGVVEGQPVRVVRAYISAGGRDCREMLIGGGLGERSALACNDDIAGWTLARPLLRGGGPGRP